MLSNNNLVLFTNIFFSTNCHLSDIGFVFREKMFLIIFLNLGYYSGTTHLALQLKIPREKRKRKKEEENITRIVVHTDYGAARAFLLMFSTVHSKIPE